MTRILTVLVFASLLLSSCSVLRSDYSQYGRSSAGREARKHRQGCPANYVRG